MRNNTFFFVRALADLSRTEAADASYNAVSSRRFPEVRCFDIAPESMLTFISQGLYSRFPPRSGASKGRGLRYPHRPLTTPASIPPLPRSLCALRLPLRLE